MGNYVNYNLSTRASIINLRMREGLCANRIARSMGLCPSMVRRVLAQEGIQ